MNYTILYKLNLPHRLIPPAQADISLGRLFSQNNTPAFKAKAHIRFAELEYQVGNKREPLIKHHERREKVEKPRA